MIAALDDIFARFAALVDEPEPARSVRGPLLAVAQDWLIRLPEGTAKELALWHLERAGEAACDALKA